MRCFSVRSLILSLAFLIFGLAFASPVDAGCFAARRAAKKGTCLQASQTSVTYSQTTYTTQVKTTYGYAPYYGFTPLMPSSPCPSGSCGS